MSRTNMAKVFPYKSTYYISYSEFTANLQYFRNRNKFTSIKLLFISLRRCAWVWMRWIPHQRAVGSIVGLNMVVCLRQTAMLRNLGHTSRGNQVDERAFIPTYMPKALSLQRFHGKNMRESVKPTM